jgi:hypothetical protein
MLFSRVGWSFTCCIERSADMWRKALLMVLGTWFSVTSFIFQFISGKLKSQDIPLEKSGFREHGETIRYRIQQIQHNIIQRY